MAIKLTTKPDIEAPSVDYEFGSIQDQVGSTPGTPVDREVYGDFHQFFEKLMNVAEEVHNDLPDNTTNRYQLFDAFMSLANNTSLSNTYSISQSGTSAPVLTSFGTNLIGYSSISGARISAGEYEVSVPGGLTLFGTAPNGLQLIASSGDVNSLVGERIDCRLADGKIYISTTIGGVPSDDVLTNYIFTLRFFPVPLY